MSARSIRRAAERQAFKVARKTGIADAQPSVPVATPELSPTPETISAARLTANRENAQKSTGPTTLEGKAISSLNAVKTGLTGRTVLLPTDDTAEYQRHTLAYQESMQPADKEQRDLVLAISDAAWRLQRIRSLEHALFAKGRVEFAHMFPEAEPALRFSLIELHTFETYEKKLRNLSLQESRLYRQREKDVAELRLRQSLRPKESSQPRPPQPAADPPMDIDDAANLYEVAQRRGGTIDPARLGFEFSIEEIATHLARRQAEQRDDSAFETFLANRPAA